MSKKILIVTASEGKNLELANKLLELSGEYQAEYEVLNILDFNLPLYSTRAEVDGTPEDAKAITDKFLSANGFVFLAPEYNGSVPPSLNNAIAWVSRSGNENWREAFNNKPVALGTHSGGGGNHVIMAMQDQFGFIGCNIVGRKIITNYSKELSVDTAKSVFETLEKLS